MRCRAAMRGIRRRLRGLPLGLALLIGLSGMLPAFSPITEAQFDDTYNVYIPWVPNILNSIEGEGRNRESFLGVTTGKVASVALSVMGLKNEGNYLWGLVRTAWERALAGPLLPRLARLADATTRDRPDPDCAGDPRAATAVAPEGHGFRSGARQRR